MQIPDICIETERLVLRPPVAGDFDAWAGFAADAETMRFLGGVQSRALSWRGFAAMAGSWALYGFGMFSVIERSTGKWIGRVGPWRPEGWPGNEIGWGIISWAQRQGYAREAAVASMDFAFDQLGWTDVIHCIEDVNVASAALATSLGSRPRGPTQLPPPHDKLTMLKWGQTREEWRRRRDQ